VQIIELTDWSEFDSESKVIEDDLEAKIILSYAEKQEIQTKIFTSKAEFFPPTTPQEEERAKFNSERIRGKKMRGYTSTNIISLKIKAKKLPSKSSVLRSGGNYDFYDDDSTGFLLEVSFSQNEKNLRNEVMKVLQKNGFGCLWSDLSAHCHKAAEYPTDSQAKELLNKLCYSISNKLNGKTISDIKVENKQQSKSSSNDMPYVCEDAKCSLNRQGVAHENHEKNDPRVVYGGKSTVSVNWQTLFIFIPIISLWALYRIKKLRRGLAIFIPVNIVISFIVEFAMRLSERLQDSSLSLTSFMIGLGISIVGIFIMIYFIRKWSKQWNENVHSFTELEKFV